MEATVTAYKVSIDEEDAYTEDYQVALGIYQLGEETGCDCRIWEQKWYNDNDEPDENIIFTNAPF